MTMKRLILAGSIACLFLVSAPDSYACFCVTPEVPDAFRAARAVFVGEVTEVIAPRTDDPKAPLADTLYAIRFKVERSWKGLSSTEVTVLSDQGRAGCFSWGPFVKGQKYLVYGERLRSGAHTRTLAVLFSCNRTALIGDASEDLKALTVLARGAADSIKPGVKRSATPGIQCKKICKVREAADRDQTVLNDSRCSIISASIIDEANMSVG